MDKDSVATIKISENSPIVAHMRILRQHIDAAQSTGTTRSITECFYGALTGSTPFPLPTDIACKSGCSYCCNTWVYATAPEIFHLASSLRADKQDALPAAISAAARVRLNLAAETRLHHLSPCPILRDDICAAYQARPAACRTAYSLDAKACQSSLLSPMDMRIPIPEFSLSLRAAHAIALDGALLHAGYMLVRYELRTALDIALSRPDAEQAWLRGEQIFSSALQEEEEPFLASPVKAALYQAAFG